MLGESSVIDQEKVDKWKKSMEDFIVEDVRKAKRAELQVSLIILCLIGVEALSGYLAGDDATGDTFKSFLNKYFPRRYRRYAAEIYSFRNGLVHDNVTNARKKPNYFYMNGGEEEPHLKRVKRKQQYPLWFNRLEFSRDFLAAWDKFSTDVSTNERIYKKAMKRAKSRGYLVVQAIK
jgi:hypothetical protein